MMFDNNYFRQMCVCVFVRPFVAQSNIKLEFMYICIRGNSFAPVSTILPLDMAAVLMVWYIYVLYLW
jgi:hypothetical protein